MKYLCLIHLDEEQLAAFPTEEMDSIVAGHAALARELQSSGRLVAAESLAPTRDGVHIRIREGTTRVVDGPFSEAKEVVGGFYLIEADDLSQAAEIAAKIPAATFGTVEVRPTRRLIVDGEIVW